MRYGMVPGLPQKLSRLVLGTMIVSTQDTQRSFQLLDAALDLGCNTLDTAHVYAGGNRERAIGQWLQERKNRDKVTIISKGAHHNADRKRVTAFDITADLHDSLARLQTDYIDVYLLHRDDPDVAVKPIVDVLNEHLRAGKIRAFGGSNWRHERIEEANQYAKDQGLTPFAASSPHFSLAEQVDDPWGPGCVAISGPKEQDAQQWYHQTQLAVFAYSSLARGFFSGRISRENFEQTKGTLDAACLKAYCHEPNFQRLDRAQELAEDKGVSVPQLALAYVLNQPLNMFALVGAANREELEASAAVSDLVLTSKELAWLENGVNL